MKKNIILTTDSGTFRAFNLIHDPAASSPVLEELDTFQIESGDDRISRRVSDQAGQFSKGARSFAAVNDGANGERHNIHLEDRRRSIAVIANRIEELVSDTEVQTCSLAAPENINAAILERLSPSVKAKISTNLRCNLVNAPKQDLLQRFLN